MLPKHRRPTHPGEMLYEEFLKPVQVTQADAADRMGMSLTRLNEIIKGKRGLTADTAILFSKLTRTSAEFWLNLQQSYDLWHALRRSHAKVRPIAVAGKARATTY